MSGDHRSRDQDISFFGEFLFSESSLEHESFEKCAFEVASEQFPSVDMVEELEESLECEKFLFLLRTKTNSLEQIDYPSLELFSQSELIF